MSRIPESLGEIAEDKKQDEGEGLWKPMARSMIEEDEELKDEIKRKDPDVAEELGLETEEDLFGDGDNKFSMFDN